jgi:MATE family multidrug resistance protein
MPGLVLEWSLATLYVLATAVHWTVRVQSGVWRQAMVLNDSGR